MKKVLTSFLFVLFGLAALVYISILRSCTPTWFKPVSVYVKPISLSRNSCTPDTSGNYLPELPVGFALTFDNEYVAEAAIEPGILGIADTLTGFSILLMDSSGQWQPVTEQFYYGLPNECNEISDTSKTRVHRCGKINCQWYFSLPDTTGKIAEIQEFMRLFNHNFSGSGLDVEMWDYTFWAKPIFASKTVTMNLQIKIETASGKKWDRQVYLRRKSDLSNR